MDRGWLMLMLIVVGSGLGCQETRFLSCRTRQPRVEARSYDLHDPFADETIGPDTATRPRTFELPRNEDRKSFDLRNIQASGGVNPPVQAYLGPGGTNVTAGVQTQPIWRQPPRSVPIASQPGFWDDTSPRYNNVVPH